MFRANALKLARKPEKRTRENMDGSPATCIVITQETQDISGCSQLETRGRTKRRSQRRALREKLLEVGTEMILRNRVLGLAHELRKERAACDESRMLRKKKTNYEKQTNNKQNKTPGGKGRDSVSKRVKREN